MSTACFTVVPTPAGPFGVVTTGEDVVLASGWTDELDALTPQIHPRLRPAQYHRDSGPAAVVDAVTAYYDGDVAAVDTVAVHQISGEFTAHAWTVLRGVPAGTTVTYSEYATRAGRPAAIRAAASACAKNAAALFVPCHRVIRLDGSLGGFRWGLPVKTWLLEHEAASITR